MIGEERTGVYDETRCAQLNEICEHVFKVTFGASLQNTKFQSQSTRR
jgi:hypothetical protein